MTTAPRLRQALLLVSLAVAAPQLVPARSYSVESMYGQVASRRTTRADEVKRCVKNGVAIASCFGFDPEDSTQYLQAALSSNASLVVIDRKRSPWIVQPLVITADNTHVKIEDHVLVLAKEGAYKGSGDGLLTIRSRRNITVSGGNNVTLKMRRADYADRGKYNHSEFRMGVWLIDSVDVTIAGLRIADTGGDGIFIGGGVPCRFPGDHRCVKGSPGSLRVHIVDCAFVDAYRNAMSVISAEDLLVERVVFTGTNGTNPMAGVDLEPDYPEQNFKNVTFRDCVSQNNNGAGFTVAFAKLNATSDAVSVSVQNLTVDGGASEGLVLSGIRPGLRGTINVSDSVVRNTWGGSGVYDKASDGAMVRLIRCSFEHSGTHPAAHGMSHQPLIVYGSGDYHGDNRSYDCGGITFEDVTVVDQHNRDFIAGDVPAPRTVRSVHGHITVHNPYGCNMSFPDSAENVDVNVTCVRQPN